jgi:DNA-binding LytR/AlgR family response regulator
MVDQGLHGRRILVVEDEYLIADDVCDSLIDAGVAVIGPVATVEDAKRLIGQEATIDAALLDINLRGEMIFETADLLIARGVPFAFATGYDRGAIPERFSDVPRIEKPLRAERVRAILEPLMKPAPGGR